MEIQDFVDSLTDEQFRTLWKFAAVGCTNTREFWLAFFLALQRRSVGPGNGPWAAKLLVEKEREDAAKS